MKIWCFVLAFRRLVTHIEVGDTSKKTTHTHKKNKLLQALNLNIVCVLESGDQKKKWSVKAQRRNCAVSLEYRLLNRCTNEKPLIVFFDWKQLYNHSSSSSAILQRLSVNRRELSSVFKPGCVSWGSRQSLLFIDWQSEQLKTPTRAKLSLTATTTTRLLRRDFSDETSVSF